MLILLPYSRREDERAAKQFKFSGPRNNLKEIITDFFQKSPEKIILRILRLCFLL